MKTFYLVVTLLVIAFVMQFCAKSVEYKAATTTTTTGTNSGNGPSTNNPASTPFTLGQTGVYYPPDSSKTDSTKNDTSKSKVPVLFITINRTSPCSASGETVDFICTGNNIPTGATYTWYLGDGSVKYTSTVSAYKYIYPNSYYILVKATSNGQIIATKDTTIKLYGSNTKPTAAFYITQPLSSNLNYINCVNQSMSNVSYSQVWDFGDGSSTSSTYSPYHIFPTLATDKTYKVLLTVKADSSACTDTISKFVTIAASTASMFCNINYVQTDSCGPGLETFTFSAFTSGLPSGAIYNWSLGDGTTNIGNSISKQYQNPSNYTVTLTFNNSALTCSQKVKAFGVNAFPKANFTYSVNSAGNVFNFSDSTKVQNGSLQLYFWDYGDGTPQGHVSSTTHTYVKDTIQRKYMVLYGVKTANGCGDNTSKTITVPSL